MRIELNTNDESPRGMRQLAALLMALAGDDASQRPVPGTAQVVPAAGGTLVDLTPQATVGINGASSEPVPRSPAGDPAGTEAGAEAAATAGDAPASTVTADEKQKRTRRTKAEMEAARASGQIKPEATGNGVSDATAAVQAGALPSTITGEPGKESPSNTIDDVRAALQRYTEKHSMQHGITLLKNYGANRISELDAAQYGLFIAECDANKD
ncbi:hypothetical protein BLA39750_02201 [Burkholderia lata]|uniref:Uncharacterized protein n=1 Tax=Burkholderia lata (strain ATCC 17760 / DSM 23089 / LMG 22485 / NCIMB 9086 / R18194 / 383) TaxID=482957 RepID=A0A6P2WKW2_BURL3|nr:hypothetical protein [Burkholderia lata]VWC95623.1 hypothetical protein BLA39750_02201 [Burkholderia lata]